MDEWVRRIGKMIIGKGKSKYSDRNLSQCRVLQNKSDTGLSGSSPQI
jgi:hypothetical protein